MAPDHLAVLPDDNRLSKPLVAGERFFDGATRVLVDVFHGEGRDRHRRLFSRNVCGLHRSIVLLFQASNFPLAWPEKNMSTESVTAHCSEEA